MVEDKELSLGERDVANFNQRNEVSVVFSNTSFNRLLETESWIKFHEDWKLGFISKDAENLLSTWNSHFISAECQRSPHGLEFQISQGNNIWKVKYQGREMANIKKSHTGTNRSMPHMCYWFCIQKGWKIQCTARSQGHQTLDQQ